MCQLDIMSGGLGVPPDRWAYYRLGNSYPDIYCVCTLKSKILVISMFSLIVVCTDIISDQDAILVCSELRCYLYT